MQHSVHDIQTHPSIVPDKTEKKRERNDDEEESKTPSGGFYLSLKPSSSPTRSFWRKQKIRNLTEK